MNRYFHICIYLFAFAYSAFAGLDIERFTEAEAKVYVKKNLGLDLYKLEGQQILLKLDTIGELIELYSLDSLRSDLYYQKAYAYGEFENNTALAIKYAHLALDEAIKYKVTHIEIDALLKLVELYAENHEYETSFKYSKIAKARAKETNDIRRIATVNMTLAYAHDRYDDYALELYRDAYKMVGHVKHNNVVVLLNNFGRVFLFKEKPNLDSAAYYLEEALKLKNELNAESLAGIESNLAEAYFAQGRYEMVEDLCSKVLEKGDDKMTTVEAFNCRRMLARTALNQKDRRMALSYINEGIALAEEYPDLHKLIKKFAATTKDVSQEMGELETYTTLDSLYSKASDALYDIEQMQKVGIIEAKMALEEVEDAVEKQEQISSARLYLIIALSAIIFFASIGFYQYFKRHKTLTQLKNKELELLKSKAQQRKLSEESEKKEAQFEERQSSTHLIHLKAKQELLLKIRDRLNTLKKGQVNLAFEKELEEIESLIENDMRNEEQWSSFLVHYEKVHPSLFNKLKAEFPELTQQDRRLIAYLKMELTSKEIAQLMGVNHQSVNKSRYRLRKKLNIPKGMKLEEFLSNI